jgi:hypothetical protein
MAMAQFQQLLESQKMVAKLGAQRCMGALGALAMVSVSSLGVPPVIIHLKLGFPPVIIHFCLGFSWDFS